MPTGVSYDCGDYLGTLEAATRRSRLRRPAGRAAAAPRDGRADGAGHRPVHLRRDHRRPGGRLGVRSGRGPSPGGRRRRRRGRLHRQLAPRPGPGHRLLHAGVRPAGRAPWSVRVLHGDTDHVARGGGTMGCARSSWGARRCGPRLWRWWRRLGAGRPTCWRRRPRMWCSTPPGASSMWWGTPTVARSWAEVAAGVTAWPPTPTSTPSSRPTRRAHVAVVEVDTETGEARLLRLVACDDAGPGAQPAAGRGPAPRRARPGRAQALFEEVAFDADGNPLTTNFADYAFPSAAELPSFELVDFATPTWVNPLGAKGIGESGTIGSTPRCRTRYVTLWPIWVCATWTCRARPSGSGARFSPPPPEFTIRQAHCSQSGQDDGRHSRSQAYREGSR